MKLVEFIVNNGDKVGSYVLLLLLVAALSYVVYAFSTGKLPTLSDYRDTKASLKTATDTLAEATTELRLSQVAHASAVVRIEFLERDLRAKDGELNDYKARLVRVETELDIYRRERFAKDARP